MAEDDSMDWGEEMMVAMKTKKEHAKTTVLVEKKMPELRYTKRVSDVVKRLWDKDTAVQKSDEWYEMRKSCITASDIGSVIPRNEAALEEYVKSVGEIHIDELLQENQYCNQYSDLDEVVLRKCNMVGGFNGNVATEWGSKYEPIAQTFYENLNKKDLLEFGLMIDEENSWLGASPDGITTDGIMLEIKCPLNRPITKIVPLSYWIQQQIQMQVCKLDRCDFMDCHFLEYVRRETWIKMAKEHLDEKGPSRYGAIFTDMGTQRYIYPPTSITTVKGIMDWEQDMYQKNPHGIVCYYEMKEYKITTIKRSKKWFELNKNTIRKAWDIILDVRTNGKDAKLKDSQVILKKFEDNKARPKRKRSEGPKEFDMTKAVIF